MASVMGRINVSLVPMPRSQRTSMTPPMREMLVLTTSMPTPRPEGFADVLPGAQNPAEDECRKHFFTTEFHVWGDRTDLLGASEQPRLIDAAAVVLDLDHDVIALLDRHSERTCRWLASGRLALLGRLDAVVDRPFRSMSQKRITQFLRR